MLLDRDARVGPNWARLGQTGLFKDLFQYILAVRDQNVLKLILKSPRIVLYWANLTQYRAKNDTPVCESVLNLKYPNGFIY